MGSPQEAALRHRLSNISANIYSLESKLVTLSPLARPDIELLISFFKDAEQNAKNEIELHQLTHGGIEARRQACAHPERYVSNAPAPPLEIGIGRQRPPEPTREEFIARKREDLESELEKSEARSLKLKRTVSDWYLLAFPEWTRVTADARTRWQNGLQFAIGQFDALKSQCEEFRASQDRATAPENRQEVDLPESAVSGSSRKGDDAPQVSPDRPFLWSEIHSIAKERTAQLDAAIRKETKKPERPIPRYGAERSQFFLLLEEKANLWADRARDVYEACLKEIGRDSSLPARYSAYHNGLSFFLGDNLRHFLYVECGCVVERPYTVRRQGQPRTYTTLEIPPGVGQLLTQIIGRLKSRIEKQFTRTGETEGWLAQVQRLMREIQPQLPNQPHATTAPVPMVPTLDLVASPPNGKSVAQTKAQLKAEIPPAATQPSDDSARSSESVRQEALLKRLQSALPGAMFKYADAACIFEVTPRTIRNWIDEGKLDEGAKRGYVTAASIKRNLASS